VQNPAEKTSGGCKGSMCVGCFARSGSECAQRNVVWIMAVPALGWGGGTGLGLIKGKEVVVARRQGRPID